MLSRGQLERVVLERVSKSDQSGSMVCVNLSLLGEAFPTMSWVTRMRCHRNGRPGQLRMRHGSRNSHWVIECTSLTGFSRRVVQ
jgi:hypothetical protein